MNTWAPWSSSGRAWTSTEIGDRVAVEIHAGCGRCERCRMGMYTSCLNYGLNYGEHNKGHRANGFTTDGGFAEYAVNHVNTLVHVPDEMSDEEATLIVTAGTAMYGLDVLGGLIAGESLVVTGPGPIGLMSVAVGKALGAEPVILTGTRDSRLNLGTQAGCGPCGQYPQGKSGGGGETHHRRQGGPLRDGMLGRRQCPERGHGHGEPGRPDLSGRLPRGAGAGRSGASWSATIFTSSASGAKGRARPTAPPPSWPRNGSTPSSCTPTPFRWRSFRPPSSIFARESKTRSRWWSRCHDGCLHFSRYSKEKGDAMENFSIYQLHETGDRPFQGLSGGGHTGKARSWRRSGRSWRMTSGRPWR